MRPILLILLVAIAGIAHADNPAHKEVWLTGKVIRKKQLMFLADDPVPGNGTGNLVALGAPSGALATMAPLFSHLADVHTKVRFYGALTPINGPHPKGSPDFAFIVRMAHPVGVSDTPPGSTSAPTGSQKKPSR